MEKQALINQWLLEQEIAHIKGWDFSHIRGRYKEEDDLPWDFKAQEILDKEGVIKGIIHRYYFVAKKK